MNRLRMAGAVGAAVAALLTVGVVFALVSVSWAAMTSINRAEVSEAKLTLSREQFDLSFSTRRALPAAVPIKPSRSTAASR